MKKAFGIMVAAVIAVVAAFSFAGCGETSLQQSDLAPLRKAITELAGKVDSLTTENGELSDRVDSLTAENGELSDKISDLTADINDLTAENGELSDRVDSLTAENGELSDKISDLTADINDLTAENGELSDRVDSLTAENGELSDRVDSLTAENGELSDRIESLNVFWTDKAEYGERETMTVYFGNRPVLKIRISFRNIYETALFGGYSLNHVLAITSLCADIYADSIVETSFVDSDNGTFVRDPYQSGMILTQNKEMLLGGSFEATEEAYAGATRFDIVICVPGTPFELARFKNVSYTR